MSTASEKTLRYSPDNGTTWMGPFSREEIDQLKAAGIIEPSFLIQDASRQIPQAAVEQAPPVVEEVGSAELEACPPPVAKSDAASAAKGAYYVNLAGTQRGPFTTAELLQLANNRTITAATLCWTQGMPEWQPAGTVLPELFSTGSGEHLESLQGFSLGRFFADVFKRHEPNETIDLFCCGSKTTTPPLESVQTGWPSPWVFARMLIVCLVLYFGFTWAYSEYQNSLDIPNIIFIGNFGIPFCVAVLFFELNIRRDVPFSKVLSAILLGGLASLIITSFLNRNVNLGPEHYWAGPIEEPAKLLAAIIIASSMRNGRILTGTLMGCAVGAGFAAFESAGYTYVRGLLPHIKNMALIEVLDDLRKAGADFNFNTLAAEYTKEHAMMSEGIKHVTQLRALLTPFGHVVWTAITAGAYWFVQNLKIQAKQRAADDRSIDFSILLDFRFLRIALIPVGLHMLWNSDLLADMGYWKYVSIGIVGWIIALRLVQAGLKQVRMEQIKARQ